MIETIAQGDHATRSSVVAYALAIGEASREAVTAMSERYAIDEGARLKLMGLVVKVAKRRMLSGHDVSSDVDAIAHLAIRHLLYLRSAAP